MSLLVVTCRCGSVESLARGLLHSAGYSGWLDIPICQGKEKTLNALYNIPQFPEVDMLRNYLENMSKYVVILGWNENGCRWTDIVHNSSKSRIEGELIVQTFGEE